MFCNLTPVTCNIRNSFACDVVKIASRFAVKAFSPPYCIVLRYLLGPGFEGPTYVFPDFRVISMFGIWRRSAFILEKSKHRNNIFPENHGNGPTLLCWDRICLLKIVGGNSWGLSRTVQSFWGTQGKVSPTDETHFIRFCKKAYSSVLKQILKIILYVGLECSWDKLPQLPLPLGSFGANSRLNGKSLTRSVSHSNARSICTAVWPYPGGIRRQCWAPALVPKPATPSMMSSRRHTAEVRFALHHAPCQRLQTNISISLTTDNNLFRLHELWARWLRPCNLMSVRSAWPLRTPDPKLVQGYLGKHIEVWASLIYFDQDSQTIFYYIVGKAMAPEFFSLYHRV